jgi:hypothetical protein
MSVIVAGFVKNGVVVPNAPLPEGAQVEIRLKDEPAERKETLPSAGPQGSAPTGEPVCLTPGELRKMPREQRQATLAAAAAIAEQDYRSDKDLTGFEAFSEEDLDDDESDSR